MSAFRTLWNPRSVSAKIIIVTCAVFALQMLSKFILGLDYPFIYGAKYNYAMAMGQWWRLVTPVVLHADFMHILSNMIGVLFWGVSCEFFLGKPKFLAVYILSGIMGNAMGFAMSANSIAIGASSSLFGLFGILLYYRTQNREVFNRMFGMQVMIILAMNIFSSFTNSGIDLYGHLGGLLGGFLAAAALGLRNSKTDTMNILYGVGYAVVFGFFIYLGLTRTPLFY